MQFVNVLLITLIFTIYQNKNNMFTVHFKEIKHYTLVKKDLEKPKNVLRTFKTLIASRLDDEMSSSLSSSDVHGDFSLNPDLSYALLDRTFKTLEQLETTNILMSKRLNILEKHFKECTESSYKTSMEAAVNDIETKIAKKIKRKILPTMEQQQCLDEIRNTLPELAKKSLNSYVECMVKSNQIIRNAKDKIFEDIEATENKVQKKLCALMECNTDTCLATNATEAITLLVQSNANSTILPIRGFKDYINVYRSQFERCQKLNIADLQISLETAFDGFKVCYGGIEPRITPIKKTDAV